LGTRVNDRGYIVLPNKFDLFIHKLINKHIETQASNNQATDNGDALPATVDADNV
jgi:hypothetical protein